MNAPPESVGTTPLSDWPLLLAAVVSRLRSGAHGAHTEEVLACACALDQTLAGWRDCQDEALRVHAGLALELAQTQRNLGELRQQVAELQHGEARARHRARHDELTDLPNRGHFREQLDHAVAGAERRRSPTLAVLFLDLDGFKRINDLHGHQAGDEMLRAVAARLARTVRADDIVCRLGGDEFACLPADGMDRTQLAQLAREMVAAVAQPLQLGELALSVRPSIGIALCAVDGATTDGLLAQADAAMYRAKRLGSGYAFFDQHEDIPPVNA